MFARVWMSRIIATPDRGVRCDKVVQAEGRAGHNEICVKEHDGIVDATKQCVADGGYLAVLGLAPANALLPA